MSEEKEKKLNIVKDNVKENDSKEKMTRAGRHFDDSQEESLDEGDNFNKKVEGEAEGNVESANKDVEKTPQP